MMTKDDYLDKKIPEGSSEPDWFCHEQQDPDKWEVNGEFGTLDLSDETIKEMHRLDEEWQKVYRKTKEYLRVLKGDKHEN